MICQICGKDVANLGMSKHLKTHDLDVRTYYDIYLKGLNEGVCKVCDKPTRFVSITTGYKVYCSQKCSMADPEVRSKISEKTKQATDKIKERNLEKYGIEWTTQLESTKQKHKETMLERYGVESPMQSETIRAKHKKSMKEHIGVEYAQQSSEVQKKTKETCLKKFGVVSPVLVEDTRQKAITNAWSGDARTKRETTCLDKFGTKSIVESAAVQEKAHTEIVNEKRASSIKNTLLLQHGVTCGYQIPEVREKALHNIHSTEAELKRIQTRTNNNNISAAEQLFMDLAITHKLDFVAQYYDATVYPFICDFYIPSKNLFVELNVFWTHNSHWYSESADDLQTVEDWKSRQNKFYDNAIYTWTDLDVRKRTIAKKNNLNYVTLWTESDIRAWFLLDCPIGKDYECEYSWYTSRRIYNNLYFCKMSSINKNVKYCQFNEFYKRELEFWEAHSSYSSQKLNEQLKLYENRLKYIGKTSSELSNLEILRGLNISGKIKAYTVFNPIGMNQFIEKYKPTTIYDPCAGWGERLLVCANSDIDYYGYDINESLKPGYDLLISHFNITRQHFSIENQDNIYNYQCLFTCPPYWNTEIYTTYGAENLSYKDFLHWWKNIIKNSNCTLVAYQINQKYKNDMNKQILDLGYSFVEEIVLPQKSSHFTRKNGVNNKKEYESIQIFIK